MNMLPFYGLSGWRNKGVGLHYMGFFGSGPATTTDAKGLTCKGAAKKAKKGMKKLFSKTKLRKLG
jgi:hypothetical protein